MDATHAKKLMKTARDHLRFACKLYRRQMQRGKFFLHEHPQTATSWRLPEVKRFLQSPGVGTAVCHQCSFGLMTPSKSGELMPAKKPTQFMSNSPCMPNELFRICQRTHVHQHLEGGRAKEAENYPADLIRAILRGMPRTTEAMHAVNLSVQAEWDAIMKVAHNVDREMGDYDNDNIQPSTLGTTEGGEFTITYGDKHMNDTYFDTCTSEPLPSKLVKQAIADELSYFNKIVWKATRTEETKKAEDVHLVRTRWVMCNKGDDAAPDIRARLVACEVNNSRDDSYFASTPPLESMKILFSDYISRKYAPDGSHLQISVVDVRKTYFNAEPVRNKHLSFPKEMGVPKGYCARLLRCVYGTRDAGLLWEECYSACLTEMGFIRGVANPCCFVHPGHHLRLVVHGDVFTCTGPTHGLDWYENELQKLFEIKMRGRLGHEQGCDKEMRILNRIVRLDDLGLVYEPDPRHAEILIRSMDIDGGSRVTPGDKPHALKHVDTPHDNALPELFPQEDEHANDYDDEPINALRVRCVAFSDNIDTHYVPTYSENIWRAPQGICGERGRCLEEAVVERQHLHWEDAARHGKEACQPLST